jgi:hypothetical protein
VADFFAQSDRIGQCKTEVLLKSDFSAMAVLDLIHVNAWTPIAVTNVQHSGKIKEGSMPVLPPQQKRHRFILAWCRDRVRGIPAQLERERAGPGEASGVVQDSAASAAEMPNLARDCYDASPLFRRMTLLQIDRDELASDDPLLFRELQGLCTLCRSKERCVQDLARECDEPGRQGWREYCPNATTLNSLGAVQNCSWAARHLKTPRSTGYLVSS